MTPFTMAERRKIRRLVSDNETRSHQDNSRDFIKGLTWFLIGVLVAILALSPDVVQNFLDNYEEQYNLLVYGKGNYCYQNLSTKELLLKIKIEILHQEHALQRFEDSLKNHTNFTTFAAIGTTGVGKTLFSNLLSQNFPWRENVQFLSWSDYSDYNTKNIKANKLLRRLSRCGHNVIIFDNLTPKEVPYIKDFTKKAEDVALFGHYRLIMVYIFNIPSFIEDAETAYRNNLKYFSNLGDIKTILFRSFNQTHLRDCIKHEAKKLNLSLSEKDFMVLEKSIQANHSGCKNVYSKLGVYA